MSTLWRLVSDLDASLRFYAGALGLEVAVEEFRAGRRVAVTLAGRGLRLRLVEANAGAWPGPQPRPGDVGAMAIELPSRDADADHRALTAHGWGPTPVRPGPSASRRWLTVCDPDGLLVAIVEELDPTHGAVT